jgi:hypothetical protein
LTRYVALAIVSELHGASVARLRLKRESGENPELPRSGKQERTLHIVALADRLGSRSK